MTIVEPSELDRRIEDSQRRTAELARRGASARDAAILNAAYIRTIPDKVAAATVGKPGVQGRAVARRTGVEHERDRARDILAQMVDGLILSATRWYARPLLAVWLWLLRWFPRRT